MKRKQLFLYVDNDYMVKGCVADAQSGMRSSRTGTTALLALLVIKWFRPMSRWGWLEYKLDPVAFVKGVRRVFAWRKGVGKHVSVGHRVDGTPNLCQQAGGMRSDASALFSFTLAIVTRALDWRGSGALGALPLDVRLEMAADFRTRSQNTRHRCLVQTFIEPIARS